MIRLAAGNGRQSEQLNSLLAKWLEVCIYNMTTVLEPSTLPNVRMPFLWFIFLLCNMLSNPQERILQGQPPWIRQSRGKC